MGLSFQADKPLYTSDAKPRPLEALDSTLDELFASGSPVVLFIHGRGNEPKKSLKGGFLVKGLAVQKLEAQYRVRVLMFNWNSKPHSLLDREGPLSQMPASAQTLREVLDGVRAYRAPGQANAGKPFTLLAHSMGNIVLQTLVQQPAGWGYAGMFSNILMTGSDADAQGHEQWVQKLDQACICFNKDDKVLAKATDGRAPGITPLGRGATTLAANAVYLDFSGLGGANGNGVLETHEMFNKSGLNYQVNAGHLMTTLLTGVRLQIGVAAMTPVATPAGKLYKVVSRRVPGDLVFANVHAEKEASEYEHDENAYPGGA
jgi:hypothetical protein